jgi:glyoxylase-like metal-dependent hydrolase (beta-lactamase superfamily II)
MGFSIVVKSLSNLGVNCVVIANESTKKLLVFDAPLGVGGYMKEFDSFGVEAVFFTHAHFDHILGFQELFPFTGQVFAHQGDREMYINPESMTAWMDPREAKLLKPVKVTHWLKGGENLTINGLQIDVRPTPGHSPGGVAYYIPALKVAIVGDTIFRSSVGRTDIPGGSQEDLEGSIRSQIFTMEEDTTLYPGHGPATTVAYEKVNNPYVGG